MGEIERMVERERGGSCERHTGTDREVETKMVRDGEREGKRGRMAVEGLVKGCREVKKETKILIEREGG